MVMAKKRLAAGTIINAKEAVEGADPQFWVAQEGIGKGQLHSAAAQSWVTKEVSRIENKSAFWEVKVGTWGGSLRGNLRPPREARGCGQCCPLSLGTVVLGLGIGSVQAILPQPAEPWLPYL